MGQLDRTSGLCTIRSETRAGCPHAQGPTLIVTPLGDPGYTPPALSELQCFYSERTSSSKILP